MRTFEADGVPHRTRDLCAYDQFHLLRLILPVLPAVIALDLDTAALDPEIITSALGGIEQAQIKAAFEAAAGAVEREDDGNWRPATKAVPLHDMLTIVLAAVDANFSDYLSRQQPAFKPMPQPLPMWKPVTMPEGESWLFRPCLSEPPLLDMLSLFDGRANLFQVAKANDLLDVMAENEVRATAKPIGRP